MQKHTRKRTNDSSCDASGDLFSLNESPIIQKESNAKGKKKNSFVFVESMLDEFEPK